MMFRWPEEIPHEEYVRLYFLEKMLRRCVVDVLSRINEKWWKQNVPGDVRIEAERRKNEEEQKLGPTLNLHPIWYIDFMDYVEIITRGDNWKQAFEQIFKNKDDFRVTMQKLAPIRNKIAHMRPLTGREKKNLDVLSEDILARVWEHLYTEPFIKPAQKLMQKGEYQQAENKLLEAFKIAEDPWIAYHLGLVYEETGKVDEAKKWYDFAEKHLALPQYKSQAKEKLQEMEEKIRRSKIRVCPKCGSEEYKTQLFCGKCGYKFET